MFARLWRVLTVVVLLLASRPAPAQTVRFELGQRLRAFERAWDQQPDPEARKRAIVPLMTAVNSFFSGRFTEVARSLDRGRHALLSDQPAPELTQWAESLYLLPETRFLDPASKELRLTLEPFFASEQKVPAGAMVSVELCSEERLVGGKKTVTIHALETSVTRVPTTLSFDLSKFTEGDCTLMMSVRVRDMVLAESSQTISLASNLARRLEALRKQTDSLSAEPATMEKATLRNTASLLDRLARKETLETNYPAARLLAEAEAVLRSIQDNKPYYDKDRAGQFWLTLAGKSTAALRIFVPESAKQGKPLPLVLALHGAGGSENLFFDGYGDGAVVRLCQKRGWLCVAPRSGAFGGGVNLADLIDEVATRYPVDRKRVFVVGHSMGAAQAVAASQQSPDRFAAVAALGGSGVVKKAEAVRELPFFIGVGDKDFALRGARALEKSLKGGGVKHVRLKEYADVEHLVIVQVALPDVFRFFDEVAKR